MLASAKLSNCSVVGMRSDEARFGGEADRFDFLALLRTLFLLQWWRLFWNSFFQQALSLLYYIIDHWASNIRDQRWFAKKNLNISQVCIAKHMPFLVPLPGWRKSWWQRIAIQNTYQYQQQYQTEGAPTSLAPLASCASPASPASFASFA